MLKEQTAFLSVQGRRDQEALGRRLGTGQFVVSTCCMHIMALRPSLESVFVVGAHSSTVGFGTLPPIYGNGPRLCFSASESCQRPTTVHLSLLKPFQAVYHLPHVLCILQHRPLGQASSLAIPTLHRLARRGSQADRRRHTRLGPRWIRADRELCGRVCLPELPVVH
jgi:hypothetical protein